MSQSTLKFKSRQEEYVEIGSDLLKHFKRPKILILTLFCKTQT